MLDRIINIKTDLNLSQNGNPFLQGKTYSKTADGKFIPYDSIIFSPAAHYLARVQWKLKEIEKISKSKVRVNFLFSGFEFQTEIDFLKLFSLSREFFKVIKEPVDDTDTSKTLVHLSVKKNKIIYMNNPRIVSLNYLNVLFERINELDIKDELNKYDCYALGEIMNDLTDGINKEFQYIISVLYTFIEKLNNLGTNQNYQFKSSDEELVTIEKIIKINGKSF